MSSACRYILHTDIAGVSSAHLCNSSSLCTNNIDYVVWFKLVGDCFETYIRYSWFFNCNYIYSSSIDVLRSSYRAMADLSGNLIYSHWHDIHTAIYLPISHHQPFVKAWEMYVPYWSSAFTRTYHHIIFVVSCIIANSTLGCWFSFLRYKLLLGSFRV